MALQPAPRQDVRGLQAEVLPAVKRAKAFKIVLDATRAGVARSKKKASKTVLLGRHTTPVSTPLKHMNRGIKHGIGQASFRQWCPRPVTAG